MKGKYKFLVIFILILSSIFFISSCTSNSKVNLVTIVDGKMQINEYYPKNTSIYQPEYVLPKNTQFNGWTIGNKKVVFPYTLSQNTIFIAELIKINHNNDNNGSTKVPNTNPTPGNGEQNDSSNTGNTTGSTGTTQPQPGNSGSENSVTNNGEGQGGSTNTGDQGSAGTDQVQPNTGSSNSTQTEPDTNSQNQGNTDSDNSSSSNTGSEGNSTDSQGGQEQPNNDTSGTSNNSSSNNPSATNPSIGNYYDGIDFNTDDKTFFLSLNSLIRKDRSITYSQVYDELNKSDVNPDKPNKLWGIYDSKDLQIGLRNGTVWNREHVWPQSKLNGASKSDFHNLRASDSKTNSNRGNLDFVEGSGRNKKTGNGYYPGDEHKGDVARILLFMATRYKDNLTLPNRPKGKGEMGYLNVLYKWHLEDPVSQFEINKNNYIYTVQKNRNPFIDHPEWFEKVWNYLKNK